MIEALQKVISDYAIENANLRIAVAQLQARVESLLKAEGESGGDPENHDNARAH
mgnify:CR=1 FL=1